MEKKKGFTLIELIAVLVIMAILALIVVSLVMSVIKKAKESFRRRSIDAYGRSVELAVSSYLLDRGSLPSNLKTLNVEYNGAKVECNIMMIKENGSVYLSECKVNNVEVLDNSTRDGWYHYNTKDYTDKEYIDIYGEELQEASINYYRAYGSIVKDYKKLSIKNIGKKVQCDVRINYDGSVYLTDCSVGKNKIKDETEDGYYHYGSFKYGVGDKITYKDNDYYVIKNSDENDSTVTMLKAEPLTVDEVNMYGGVGTDNNYVNVETTTYPTADYYKVAYNVNGYGGMAFYSSSYCRTNSPHSGCRAGYNGSHIRHVVNAWGNDNTNTDDLEIDFTGYSVRLITYDELMDNLGYGGSKDVNENVPSWVYNDNYWYWTMTEQDYVTYFGKTNMFSVGTDGNIYYSIVSSYGGVVRPVITIKKSAIN